MNVTAMDESEIDSFLRDRDSGVLSLTDGGESYGIPESFGYDGKDIYFQLSYTEDSRKLSFIETTDTASFTAYVDGDAPASVVVRGAVERVTDEGELRAANALAENTVVPILNVYPERSLDELEFDFYRLHPEKVTGRRFGTHV